MVGARLIAQKHGIDLSQISAKELIWVTITKDAAKRYGNNVEEVPIDNALILACDGDGGYLVLKNSDLYAKYADGGEVSAKTISHFVNEKKLNEILSKNEMKPKWKHYIESEKRIVVGSSFALSAKNLTVESVGYPIRLEFDSEKLIKNYKTFYLNGNRTYLQTMGILKPEVYDTTAYTFESTVPDELFVEGNISPLSDYLISIEILKTVSDETAKNIEKYKSSHLDKNKKADGGEVSENTLSNSVWVRDTLIDKDYFNSLPENKRTAIFALINEFNKIGYIDSRTQLGPNQSARMSDRERERFSNTALEAFRIEREVKELLKSDAQVDKEADAAKIAKAQSRKSQLDRQIRDLETIFPHKINSARSNATKVAYEKAKAELEEVNAVIGSGAKLADGGIIEEPTIIYYSALYGTLSNQLERITGDAYDSFADIKGDEIHYDEISGYYDDDNNNDDDNIGNLMLKHRKSGRIFHAILDTKMAEIPGRGMPNMESGGEIYYHGTNTDFSKFQKKYFGKGEGSNMLGEGVYLARNVKKAKEYGKIIKHVEVDKSAKIIDYDSIKWQKGYGAFLDKYKGDMSNAKLTYAQKHYDGVSYGSEVVMIFNLDKIKIVDTKNKKEDGGLINNDRGLTSELDIAHEKEANAKGVEIVNFGWVSNVDEILSKVYSKEYTNGLLGSKIDKTGKITHVLSNDYGKKEDGGKVGGKFTFKTEKPTGKWKSFDSDIHYIKLNGKQVGQIDPEEPYTIRLMVVKKDINEDGNPNCTWKRIKLVKDFKSLQEAKDFMNNNSAAIIAKYNFYMGMEDGGKVGGEPNFDLEEKYAAAQEEINHYIYSRNYGDSVGKFDQSEFNALSKVLSDMEGDVMGKEDFSWPHVVATTRKLEAARNDTGYTDWIREQDEAERFEMADGGKVTKGKQLKFWNGAGFGKLNRYSVYIAAYSAKQAAEFVHQTCGGRATLSTIKTYFSEGTWGNNHKALKDSITEPCVYAAKNPNGSDIFKVEIQKDEEMADGGAIQTTNLITKRSDF